MTSRIRRLLLLAPLALLGACGSSGSAETPQTTALATSTTAAAGNSAPSPTDAPPVTDAPATAPDGTQQIKPGYGYLTVRDGITLSVNVVLPGSEKSGPYPTVLEYSGYEPSNPESTASSAL